MSLQRRLRPYHGPGCAILVGTRSGVAVALHATRQGVLVLGVHDVAETRQALSLQEAVGGTG